MPTNVGTFGKTLSLERIIQNPRPSEVASLRKTRAYELRHATRRRYMLVLATVPTSQPPARWFVDRGPARVSRRAVLPKLHLKRRRSTPYTTG